MIDHKFINDTGYLISNPFDADSELINVYILNDISSFEQPFDTSIASVIVCSVLMVCSWAIRILIVYHRGDHVEVMQVE